MKPDSQDPSRFDEGPEDRLRVLAAILEVESAFLEQCVLCGEVRLEVLPEERDEFTPLQLSRLRRLRRICRDLEIDVFAGCIIVDLLDRMDGLQNELQSLRVSEDDRAADL